MTTPEGAVKTAIRKYLDQQNIYYDNVRGGTYSRPGSPDIVMCLDGRYVGLEAKAADGASSPIQEIRARQIRRSGGIYAVVRSVDDVIGIINDLRS